MSKDSLPKIAILLAAFNGSEWIEQQIETLLGQVGVRVHVYVSLDLSSDHTLAILKEYVSRDARITLLSYGEIYGGAAKNFFRLIRDVDFSSYDFVALSDQDDIWLPNKLFRSVQKIDALEVAAYSSNVIALWSSGRTKLINKSSPQKKYDFLFEAGGPGCTYVLKTGAFLEFKSFLTAHWNSADKIVLHDWLIYAYFRSNNYKWFIDPAPSILYRQHANNQLGVNYGLLMHIKRILKIKNKWYKTEVEGIATMLDLKLPTKAFILFNFFQLRRRASEALLLFMLVVLGIY